MARKKKRKKREKWIGRKRKDKPEKKARRYPILTSRLKRWIVAVLMFLLAVVVSFSFFAAAGKGGELIFKTFYFLIGKTAFSLPLLLVIGGILLLRPQKKRIFAPVFGGILLLLLSLSGFFEILKLDSQKPGGFFGYALSWPFLKFFGVSVSVIIFAALFIISILILWEFIPKRLKIAKKEEDKTKDKKPEEKEDQKKEKVAIPEFEIKRIKEFEKRKELPPKAVETPGAEEEILPEEIKGEYKTPPLELLSSSKEEPSTGNIEYLSLVIKKTLANFGIQVEMGEVNIGPTVTQFTLKPAEGIKLAKIVGLSNDLALALASHPIRIEAPIPGKSLVGIEVPNKQRAEVRLGELLSQPQFRQSSSALTLPLGRDVAGIPAFAVLEKMPHLLVAGSTGSGKTIFLQNLIVSLIYKNSPQILRLILVDPKRVEFPVYSNLPHLLTPVIFNGNKTVNVLSWLIGEMERRFGILSATKTRDIQGYNKLLSKNLKLREEYGIMPYIVLIIDELADLMAAKGREIEGEIVRLSQLARATGIHLVVATQRPSVDVITGLIKANLTSRISFQVASQVDSRTVLDMAGAETLLGRGDMLFLSSEYGKPKRIQGCYVTQKEVKRVIDFVVRENIPKKKEEIEERLSRELEGARERVPGELNFDDPMFEEAKRVVIEYKKASASLLQRRLKIGYARAARLLDMLEEKGIVGPGEGAKPREVYFDKNDQLSNDQ